MKNKFIVKANAGCVPHERVEILFTLLKFSYHLKSYCVNNSAGMSKIQLLLNLQSSCD